MRIVIQIIIVFHNIPQAIGCLLNFISIMIFDTIDHFIIGRLEFFLLFICQTGILLRQFLNAGKFRNFNISQRNLLNWCLGQISLRLRYCIRIHYLVLYRCDLIVAHHCGRCNLYRKGCGIVILRDNPCNNLPARQR